MVDRSPGFFDVDLRLADLSARQRNTIEEKKAIGDGRIPEARKDKPAKLAHKDRDARWTVKYHRAKPKEDGSVPPVDLAIPAFGYKNHVAIDRGFGLIRNWTATHAAAHDGARLEMCWIGRTRPVTFGRTPPIDRRRTRRCLRQPRRCRLTWPRPGVVASARFASLPSCPHLDPR